MAIAPVGVQAADQAGEIAHMAVRARILEDGAEDVDRIEIGEGIADDDAPAERLGAGLDQRDRLRMAVRVDEEGLGLRLGHALGHAPCASAAAVASSSSEALATSRPVRSQIIVW